MKKCAHCGDPIYRFQKCEIISNQKGKKQKYHKDCYEIIIGNWGDKVKGG